MIHPSVLEEVNRLKSHWQPYLARSPELALDDSWPSVGVLDNLTFPLRLRQGFEAAQSELTRQVAAYLAVLAHKCWESFGCEVMVEIGATGVTITATSGPGINAGTEMTVHVEREIRALLHNLPSPFPVVGEHNRFVSFDQNVLSLFAFGLCTGLSPVGDGPWAELELREGAPQVERTATALAVTCADRYARIYPDEPLGQVGELYLERLISPPLLVDEPLPALSAVAALLAFFHRYKVGREAILRLSRNLALSADETISIVGLAFYGALVEGTPDGGVMAAAQAKGRFVGLVRNAMLAVRKALGLSHEWIGSSELSGDVIARFTIEQQLGFLPWVFVTPRKLKTSFGDPRFHRMLAAAADFDLDAAIAATDEIIDVTPADIEMRIQRIQLEALRGDHDVVHDALKSFATEPDVEREPRFHDLMGLSFLARKDPESARKSFLRALQTSTPSSGDRAEILNNIGWAHLMLGQLDEALERFDESLKLAPEAVTTLLNKGHVLWQLDRPDDIAEIEAKLFRLCPTHRAVFAIVLFREARDRASNA